MTLNYGVSLKGPCEVEYGKERGIPTPYDSTMAKRVRAMEGNYLTR